MAANKPNFFDKVFKDKHGKIILWQNPNIPLWVWIGCSILGLIFKNGHAHTGIKQLGTASIFTWAYLEIRYGDSIFRRILGTAVMVWITYGFFKA